MLFVSLATKGYAQKYQNVYRIESMKPVDSMLKVKEGDQAPLFTLRSVNHGVVSLEQYRGKKNVVLSFVPAAWTPICSDQWPGYNIVEDIFEQHDSVLLGITVDNIPTLHAWMKTLGNMWFPVLSDFWPHGEVAGQYGVLRSDGLSERAIFIIDKKGIIRYIDVHDVNIRPELEKLVRELEKIN
ncbi:MAG: redoxin domain-containing protein [Candidatus Omnitrophica bacterium]|nr:redoxin domain-containing protein [Candidatus Omnitrophota bacterium]